MSPALGHSPRIRGARIVVLLVATLALAATRESHPYASAFIFASICVAANAVLWFASGAARMGYDSAASVLDIGACVALVVLSGGRTSPLAMVFIFPGAVAAWMLTPAAAAGVVTLSVVALAASAPPTVWPEDAGRFALTVAVMACTAGTACLTVAALERARPDIGALSDLPSVSVGETTALRELSRAIGGLVRAQATLLYVPDEAESLRLAEAPLDLGAVAMEGAERLAESELLMAAVRARRGVLAARAEHDERVPADVRDSLRASSVLAVPVHFRESLAGLIVALNRTYGGFSDEDLAVAQLAVSTVVARLLATAGDPLRLIVRELPDPAVLLSSDGRILEENPSAAELLRDDAELRALLAGAAREAAAGGSPGTFRGAPESAGSDVVAIPIGPRGRDGVLARVMDGSIRPDSELRGFSLAVSRSIDAPLRAIRDYAAALIENAEAGAQTTRRFAQSLLEQAGLLGLSIDELLATSLSNIRADDLRLETHDLARVVRDRVERVALTPGVGPISCSALGPVPTLLDEPVMARALDALLGASARVSRSGLEVTALRSDDGPTLVLQFRHALPTRLRRRLLEPFAISREGSGLGVGIALARHVVRAHGGVLSVSEDGRSIIVTLPSP